MEEQQQYIQLDSSYDALAKSIAVASRQHTKITQQLGDLDNNYVVFLNRMELYLKNVIWKNYSQKEHSFLFTNDDKIIFVTQEDIAIARAKYEAKIEETRDILSEEFEAYYNEYMIIDGGTNREEFKQYIDFLVEQLKNVLYSAPVTDIQRQHIKEIVVEAEKAQEKFFFAKECIAGLETEYNECMEEIIERLESDNNYDYDPEIHEILTVRDESTMMWHLIYLPMEK